MVRVPAAVFAGMASLAALRCTTASTSIVSPTTNKCQIGLSTGQSSFTSSGGQGSVVIATERDCSWTVSSDTSWISISGSRQGQGAAQVAFSVAANPVPSARSGAISSGDVRVQLSQAAAPCTYQLSRTSDSIGYAGGRLSVGVTTLTGCSWSTSSSAAWITIESGASGSASGSIGISAAANTGGARVGQLTIAGQRYTLTQSAAPESPAPSPGPAPSPVPDPLASADFEGKVSALAGKCPDVTFSAAGLPVVASSATDYHGGACKDLSNGDKVRVRGLERADGAVGATRIDFK